MRATEICGEVFCEIWAVFLTVWLVVRNATLHHPECHTLSSEMPHLTTLEVWHFGRSGVAFRMIKFFGRLMRLRMLFLTVVNLQLSRMFICKI